MKMMMTRSPVATRVETLSRPCPRAFGFSLLMRLATLGHGQRSLQILALAVTLWSGWVVSSSMNAAANKEQRYLPDAER
jgi:hypothetical protein